VVRLLSGLDLDVVALANDQVSNRATGWPAPTPTQQQAPPSQQRLAGTRSHRGMSG
jgi:hypothetical protein